MQCCGWIIDKPFWRAICQWFVKFESTGHLTHQVLSLGLCFREIISGVQTWVLHRLIAAFKKCACVCGGEPEVAIRWLPLSLLTLCFETGSLTEPEAHQFTSTRWPQRFRDPLFFPDPQISGCHYRCTPMSLVFMWVLRIWTQVLIFKCQAFYRLWHLPRCTALFNSRKPWLIQTSFLGELVNKLCFNSQSNTYYIVKPNMHKPQIS